MHICIIYNDRSGLSKIRLLVESTMALILIVFKIINILLTNEKKTPLKTGLINIQEFLSLFFTSILAFLKDFVQFWSDIVKPGTSPMSSLSEEELYKCVITIRGHPFMTSTKKSCF